MSRSPQWISGVDEPLPAGEHILWRGNPRASAVARHVLYVRVWAAYLAVLTVVVAVSAVGTYSLGDVAKLVTLPLLLAVAVLGGVAGLARLSATSSEYVVTNRRVVMRVGIAVPIAINIPFSVIDDAGLRVFRDGTGELRLSLSNRVKLAYIALWPHVESLRHMANPRPKLRGLDEPERIGLLLRDAIAADAARLGDTVQLGELGGSDPRERRGAAAYAAASGAMVL